MSIFAETTPTKKRIYISNLERKSGISSDTADKIRNIIKLTILEKNSIKYRIISDDDIKVMFKQAETLQSSDNQDKNTTLNIAEAINANEIIYGTVSRENGKIHINISNLETGLSNPKKGSGTKSIADVVFEEKDLEWMSREAALKLMNPKYKILTKPAFNNIQFNNIEIIPPDSKNLSIITYDNDSNLKAIMDFYKEIMNEGDILYNNNKPAKARNKYQEIIKSINQKMSSENKLKIEPFIIFINEKISMTVLTELKPEIEKVDNYLKSRTSLSEKDLNKAKKKYMKISKKIPKATLSGNNFSYLLSELNKRNDVIIYSSVEIKENKGDFFYNSYKFLEALNEYYEASCLITELKYEDTKNKAIGLKQKRALTIITAKNYLENKIISLIDQAEYFNVINNQIEAKNTMSRAKKEIMSEQQVRFATIYIINKYNEYAKKIPDTELISEIESQKIIRQAMQPENDITWKDDIPSAQKAVAREGTQCLTGFLFVGIIIGGIVYIFSGGE